MRKTQQAEGCTRACDLGAADAEGAQQAAAVATRRRISARVTQSGGPWKVAYGDSWGRRVTWCAGNKCVGHGRRGGTCCFFSFLPSASEHSHTRHSTGAPTCSACSSRRTPRTSPSSASAPGAHASKKSAPATPSASRGAHCASGARFCAECAGKPERCTGKQSLTSQNLPPSSCSKNASPAPPQPPTSRSVRACSRALSVLKPNQRKAAVSPCSAIPKQRRLLGT